jgi:hypothetical protein
MDAGRQSSSSDHAPGMPDLRRQPGGLAYYIHHRRSHANMTRPDTRLIHHPALT